MKPDKNHSLHRIFLPSDKPPEFVRVTEAQKVVREGLQICRDCGSELVQPISWAETADERWEIALSCPNCWWSTEGVFDREQLLELEDRLDEGIADLISDLQRLTQANMAEEVERFVAALKADHILPEDF
jgi:hypothetical protein